MLVQRELFEQENGFDTGYRNGFEDVDLCLRLGELGYEIHYCHDSVLYHLESVSPGRFENERANAQRYRQKWLNKAKPDDLNYYREDGLLHINYTALYPIHLVVSPLLATLDIETHEQEAQRLLHIRTHQIAAFLREIVQLIVRVGELELQMQGKIQFDLPLSEHAFAAKLSKHSAQHDEPYEVIAESPIEQPLNREAELHSLWLDAQKQLLHRDKEILAAIYKVQALLAKALEQQSSGVLAFDAPTNPEVMPSGYLAYYDMIRRLRHAVELTIPPSSTIAVISKGDDELLRLGSRQVSHFPQDKDGRYIGYHPEDSTAAIAYLEAVRHDGINFLLIPGTALWWLDQYPDFRKHLETHYETIYQDDDCRLYELIEVVQQNDD
jgi:hypothetical protein